MLGKAIGLKTHQWENDSKSILLLMAFPGLLLLLLWLGCLGLSIFMGEKLIPLLPAEQAQEIIQLLESKKHYANADNASANPASLNIDWQVVFSQTQMLFQQGYLYALAAAALWLLIAYAFHHVFLNNATGAKAVTRMDEPDLYNLLENLCISRGLSVPKLQIIETSALNAYASGLSEKSYTISVTRGLLNVLDKQELECVLAHELTHIMQHDVRLLVVTTIFVGMLSFLAELMWRSLRSARFSSRGSSGRRSGGGGAVFLMLMALLLLWIGTMLGLLLRLALSRKREYLADAGAVELTKNPSALASALRKISTNSKVKNVPPEVRSMFIDFPEPKFNFMGLFTTHPPMPQRLAALELLGASAYTSGATFSEGSIKSTDTSPEVAPASPSNFQGPWG